MREVAGAALAAALHEEVADAVGPVELALDAARAHRARERPPPCHAHQNNPSEELFCTWAYPVPYPEDNRSTRTQEMVFQPWEPWV